MADVITSIATAGGYQTTTVTAAYDLLFRKALIAFPQMRQFVDVRPSQVTHSGSSVRLQLDQPFSEAAVTAAKTALNEEVDPDTVQMPATKFVDLTPIEQGFYTKRTRKLANRTMVEIDPAIAWAVADNCVKVLDEIIQDRMIAGVATANTLFGAAGAAINLQTNASTLTALMVRKAVLKLRVAQSLPWDGQYYAAAVHPNVVYDLRSETGSGGWRVPNEYGAGQGNIWAGEIGEFEGVRFLENPRTRLAADGAASAVVHRSFFLGREALAEITVVEPGLVIGPYTDAFERFRKVGWYGDIGWSVFRQESEVLAYTGSSANA